MILRYNMIKIHDKYIFGKCKVKDSRALINRIFYINLSDKKMFGDRNLNIFSQFNRIIKLFQDLKLVQELKEEIDRMKSCFAPVL